MGNSMFIRNSPNYLQHGPIAGGSSSRCTRRRELQPKYAGSGGLRQSSLANKFLAIFKQKHIYAYIPLLELMRLRLVCKEWEIQILGHILETYNHKMSYCISTINQSQLNYPDQPIPKALSQPIKKLDTLFQPFIGVSYQEIWEVSSLSFPPPCLCPLLECLRLLVYKNLKIKCGPLLHPNREWRQVLNQIFNFYPDNTSLQCIFYYSEKDILWFLNYFDFDKFGEVEAILGSNSKYLQPGTVEKKYGKFVASINNLVHGLLKIFQDFQAEYPSMIDYMRAIKYTSSQEAIVAQFLKERMDIKQAQGPKKKAVQPHNSDENLFSAKRLAK